MMTKNSCIGNKYQNNCNSTNADLLKFNCRFSRSINKILFSIKSIIASPTRIRILSNPNNTKSITQPDTSPRMIIER